MKQMVATMVFIWGCKDPSPQTQVHTQPVTASKQAQHNLQPQVPQAQGAGHVIEEEGFKLVASAPSVSLNTASAIALHLDAKGKHHVNLEFPTTIEASGPGALGWQKTSFEAKDAKQMTEAKAWFELPLTPTAQGQHEAVLKVSFAVCTPESCMPEERTLRLPITVK